MKTTLILVSIAAAMTGFVSGSQSEWTWTEPEMGKVTIEGVCSLDENKVSCWDASGKLLPDLSQSVLDRLSKSTQPLEFRYGMKNRYLVTKWENKAKNGYPHFEVPGGVAYQTGELILIATDPKKDSVDVDLKFDYFGPPDLRLEPKAGKVAKTDSAEIKVGKIVKSKGGIIPRMTLQSESNPVWRVYIEPKGVDLQRAYITRLMKGGKSFSFVDSKGVPILGETAPTALKPSIGTLQVSRQFPPAEVWWIDSNIDPGKLEEIGFALPKSKSKTFHAIPLDPRP